MARMCVLLACASDGVFSGQGRGGDSVGRRHGRSSGRGTKDASEDIGYRVTFFRALDKRAKRIDLPEGESGRYRVEHQLDLVADGLRY